MKRMAKRKNASRTAGLLASSNRCLGRLLRCASLHTVDGVQDRVDGSALAHIGIHHQMELVPVGPVHVEILLDESRAFLIDSLGEMRGITFALATGTQAADLVLERSVDENVEGVAATLQVIR